MTTDNLKLQPFLWILLPLSGIIWFVIGAVSGLNMQSMIDFMRPIPDVITLDVVLIFLFAKWGWRCKYLQGWLVPFPDLNGTWRGSIQTSWKDDRGNRPGPIPVVLTIKQTFGKVSCVMRTAEMVSNSYAEGFRIDSERQIRQLCYSYTSKPKVRLRERSTPHDGTMILSIIGKPVKKLEGEYWTQRGTTGTAIMTSRRNELIDELPSDMPEHPMTDESARA